MENRRAPAERRENKSVVSNNVKKAPRETASVGIPRNAAAEARRLPQQPTGRQIDQRADTAAAVLADKQTGKPVVRFRIHRLRTRVLRRLSVRGRIRRL